MAKRQETARSHGSSPRNGLGALCDLHTINQNNHQSRLLLGKQHQGAEDRSSAKRAEGFAIPQLFEYECHH